MRKPVDTRFVWWVKRKICKSEIINSDVSPVNLLPLRPASLTHKNPRRRQITHGNASSRTQRSVDRSEDVSLKNAVRVISVAVITAVI